jgi:hypothetical protein
MFVVSLKDGQKGEECGRVREGPYGRGGVKKEGQSHKKRHIQRQDDARQTQDNHKRSQDYHKTREKATARQEHIRQENHKTGLGVTIRNDKTPQPQEYKTRGGKTRQVRT